MQHTASAAPPDDPRIGTILQDRYRICERIAAGGMGVVYRGERVGLDKPVAIKFVHAFMASEPDILRRFQVEARAMSRVAHPACVSVIDFGVDAEGAPYLVMDFVTGVTLRRRIEHGPVPVEHAVTLMRQLLSGLEHAHAQGIVHRDIKPENVLLSEVVGLGSQVRILDFGVAKLLDSTSAHTTGFAIGTPSYMAPEQTTGGRVDARTDVYAAGVMLFELLTGLKPFQADDIGELLRLHREAAVPSPRSVLPDLQVSAEMEAVVGRAMAKAPEQRFQTARAFAEALEATPELRLAGAAPQRGESVPPMAPPSARPTVVATGRGRSRWRGRAAVVAGAALILAASGVVVWNKTRTPAASAAEAVPSPAAVASAASAPHDNAGASASVASAPAGVPGIERVDELLRARRWHDAVRLLEDLKKRHPENAYLPYRLGHLYCEKYWGRQGVEAYREAVHRNPSYKTDPEMIRDVIGLFITDHAWLAEKFLREVVGAGAIPLLEETRKSKNPVVRRRAERVLSQLD